MKRRLLSLLLACVMLFSLISPAYAEEENTATNEITTEESGGTDNELPEEGGGTDNELPEEGGGGESGENKASDDETPEDPMPTEEETPSVPAAEPEHVHTPLTVDEIPATEDKPGVTAGVVCADCGEILEGCEEIPAIEAEVETEDEDGDEETVTVITILSQPSDAVPTEGTALFSVEASVNTDETIFYAWQRLDESVTYDDEAAREAAWEDIEGENSAELRLAGLDDEETLAAARNYAFRCVLTAGEARAVSAEARLSSGSGRRNAPAAKAAAATSGSCGDNLTWSISGGTLTITGTGAMKDYDNGTTPWYSSREQITRVVINSGATTVGVYAFHNFTSLTSVSLPNTLESIKLDGFSNCTSLKSFSMPSSVTFLGQNVFDGDTLLSSVTLSSNLTEINKFDFRNCSSLTSITIPSGVTILKDYAFAGCTSLKSISLPSTVTELGKYAFSRCSALTSITLPQNLATVGENAFLNATGLRSITIKCPDVTFGSYAFKNCSALTSVTSPIWKVYESCEPTSLTVPSTVSVIRSNAYKNCTSFTSVTIPSGITGMGSMAFNGCKGLKSIVLPNGLQAIGDYAFGSCTALTSITIPDSVTTIKYYAFVNTTALADVYYDGSIDEWNNISIGINNEPLTSATLHCTRSGSCGTNLTWKLTKEGELIFSGSGDMYDFSEAGAPWYPKRSMITALTVGNDVTGIGSNAFYGCFGLTSVDIPVGVQRIGAQAFGSCSGLTTVNIPGSVTSLSGDAFHNCGALSTIYYGGNAEMWAALVGEEIDESLSRAMICCGYVNESDVGYLKYTISGSTVSITGYKGSLPAELFIPAGIGGKAVTNIAANAFKGCTGLTSVTISEGVKSIGNYAFSGCTGLTSLEIPGSVTSIGNYAFSGCTGLTSLEIPGSVTSIGSHAFFGCTGLTTAGPLGGDYAMRFGWTSSIPAYAFYCLSGLTSITLPNGVASIGSYAFSGCLGLTSFEIPEGVTSVGSYAFEGCTGLTSLEIPASVTSISGYAFENCTGLTTAGPLGGDYAMRFGWTSSIPAYAFYGLSGLTSVTLPNGVTSIGGYAFNGCTGLTSLEIPESVTSIGQYAFRGCAELTSAGPTDGDCKIRFGWTDAIPANAFYGSNYLYRVVLPDGMQSIGSNAFYGCSSLNRVILPTSLTSIGSSAFSGCTKLTTAGPAGGNYAIQFGWTNRIPDTIFYGGKGLSSLASVVIPEGMTEIGASAFNGCTGLTSVMIPKSLNRVCNSAFYDCSNLTDVYYPGNATQWGSIAKESGNTPLTRAQIHYNYYAGADLDFVSFTENSSGGITITGLTDQSISNLIIPDGVNGKAVTAIGSNAFSGCTGLSSVTIPASVKNINSSAFSNCTGLTSLTIPAGVTSIGGNAFSGCTGLTSVTIPASVTSFGSNVFSGCTGLRSAGPMSGSYAIRFGWTGSIPDSAFSASELVSVVIPNGISKIGNAAFSNCSALASVTIPGSVTEFGWSSFNGCTKLTTAGPTGGDYAIQFAWTDSIPSTAFRNGYGFDQVKSVVIPEGVKSIGAEAFYYCSALTDVTIPSSMTSIGNSAFGYCTALEKVYYRGTEEQWNSISIGYSYYGNSLSNATRYYISRSGDEIPYLRWELKEDGTISITGYSGELPGALLIPGAIDKIAVTEIAAGAFENAAGITSVTVPLGVSRIGARAFAGCGALTEATIPGSVSTLGNAFAGCTGLESVTIGNGVTSIGDEAFSGCTGLTSITIPNSVTSIGDEAFSGCTGLSAVTLGNNVTTIGAEAFAGCTGLTSITIPNSVTVIGDEAFAGCTGLVGVTLGEGVTAIGAEAFSGCNALTDVTIPGSVSTIGKVFAGCTGLESVTLGEGVRTIEAEAFSGCTGLTSITIPNSVTGIGDEAFAGCTGLADIALGEGVTTIGDGAFTGCNALTNVTVPGSVSTLGNAFAGCTGLESVTLGEGVKTICDGAFASCTGLTSITIPGSVTNIGDGAFTGCNALTNVTVPGSVSTLGNAFAGCTGLESVTLGEGVNTIGEGAFAGCTSLASISVPGSVTGIGDEAFSGCASLAAITIPNGVTSIGDEAFEGCAALSEVTIPASVSSIGEEAFSGCTGLEKMNFEGNAPSFGKDALAGTDMIIYHVPGAVWPDDALAEAGGAVTIAYSSLSPCGENLTWGVFDGSVLRIYGSGAMTDFAAEEDAPWFGMRTTITKIQIDEGVTHVGNYAFVGIVNATELSLPDSLQSIGMISFGACRALPSVTIPEGVTSIDVGAFAGCTGLQELTIPVSTELSFSVFQGCEALNSFILTPGSGTMLSYTAQTSTILPWNSETLSDPQIQLRDGIQTIGKYAFYHCAVAEIVLPDSVTVIGDHAFDGCERMSFLQMPVSAQVNQYSFTGCNALTKFYLTAGTGVFRSYTSSTYTYLPWNNPNLTADTIEVQFLKNIQTIGDYAFYNNSRIVLAYLPDSVLNIGLHAFHGCTNLLMVKFPENLIRISNYAFCECFRLMSVSLPEKLLSIGDYAFAKNESPGLTSIVVPESVTSIGSYAFSEIKFLKNAQLPSTIETIPAGLFYKDMALIFFDIPESVRTIGTGAFSGCMKLSQVVIPEGVTTIGKEAFQMAGMSTLFSVSLPNSLTTIGESAFGGSGLRVVRIPKNVTSIDKAAFLLCENLQTVYVDRTGTLSIGLGAFMDCPRIKDVYYAAGAMQWSSYVSIADLNDPLKSAKYHYYNSSALSSGILLTNAAGERINQRTVEFDLSAGNTMTLFYEILPNGATTSLSWSCGKDTMQLSTNASAKTVTLKALKTGSGYLQVTDLKSGANTAVFFSIVRRVTAITITGDGDGKIGLDMPLQLNITTTPSNATNKTVVWSVENGTGEATISSDGVITATKKGTVTVFAAARDGSGVIGSKTLVVEDYGIVSEQSVEETYLRSGKTLQLKAVFTPANLYGTKILWSVSPTDSQFASVSAKGLVTAKTATETHHITVTATAADGSASLDFHIAVYPAAQNLAITDAEGAVVTGKTVSFDLNREGLADMSFTATVRPEDAARGVKWTLTDKNKKKVAVFTDNGDGTVTIQPNGSGRTGSVSLTATATDGSGKKASVTVSFVRLAQARDNLSITNAPAQLRGGAAVTLKTSIGGIAALTNRTLNWELSEESRNFAAISTAGKLSTYAVDEPTLITVNVCAKANPEAKDSVTILLTPAVQSVTISASATKINLGETAELTASVLPSNAIAAGSWKSSDSKIASVSAGGVVTAKKTGAVTVTFTAADGSGKKASVKITVVKPATIPVEVQEIAVTAKNDVTEIQGGKTLQLKATVLPANATKKSVSWKSSDTTVATVNEKGLVTAKKLCTSGDVTITATATDGSEISGSITLRIAASTIVKIDMLTITGNTAIMSGKTATLKAVRTPSKPTVTTLAWSSSDPSVATVNASGVVTAKTVLEPRTVTITAAATDGSGVLAEHTITVYPPTRRINILFDAAALNNTTRILDTAESITMQLSARCLPAGKTMDVPVKWKSSNTKVAAVNADGLVTAKAAGTVTITATAADGSGTTASFKLTVRASVHSMNIREGDGELRGGTKRTLHVDFAPIKPTNAKVTWSLRPQDTSYASVSSAGVLTAKGITGEHTVVVTATSKEDPNISASVTIRLYPTVSSVRVFRDGREVSKKTLTVTLAEAKEGIQLEGVCYPADARDGVSWKSSDTKIAKVSADGIVTALKKGTVTITVTATDGSKKAVTLKIKIQ